MRSTIFLMMVNMMCDDSEFSRQRERNNRAQLRDGYRGSQAGKRINLVLLQDVRYLLNTKWTVSIGCIGVVRVPLDQDVRNLVEELCAAPCDGGLVKEAEERSGVARSIGAKKAQVRRQCWGNRLLGDVREEQATWYKCNEGKK